MVEFIGLMLNRRLKMNRKKYVKVSDILEYCKDAAANCRSLADKCIKSVGKGESESSSLGGAAYFLQQADIYQFKIPEIIKSLNHEELETDLDTPIEALEFTTRVYNCLRRSGIKTLGDITEKYAFELSSTRNLGKKGFYEVLDILKTFGVSLKGEKDE